MMKPENPDWLSNWVRYWTPEKSLHASFWACLRVRDKEVFDPLTNATRKLLYKMTPITSETFRDKCLSGKCTPSFIPHSSSLRRLQRSMRQQWKHQPLHANLSSQTTEPVRLFFNYPDNKFYDGRTPA